MSSSLIQCEQVTLNDCRLSSTFALCKGIRIPETESRKMFGLGIRNPEICACKIKNPGLWNPEYRSENPVSMAWNSESKTVLDSLQGASTSCILNIYTHVRRDGMIACPI